MCDTAMPPAGSGDYDIMINASSCMIAIYICTLCFNIHNVILYLIKQKRYKTWLIAIFYLISEIVLISRISYFIIDGNNLIYLRDGGVSTSDEFVHGVMKALVARTISLYAKIALGFF